MHGSRAGLKRKPIAAASGPAVPPAAAAEADEQIPPGMLCSFGLLSEMLHCRVHTQYAKHCARPLSFAYQACVLSVSGLRTDGLAGRKRKPTERYAETDASTAHPAARSRADDEQRSPGACSDGVKHSACRCLAATSALSAACSSRHGVRQQHSLCCSTDGVLCACCAVSRVHSYLMGLQAASARRMSATQTRQTAQAPPRQPSSQAQMQTRPAARAGDTLSRPASRAAHSQLPRQLCQQAQMRHSLGARAGGMLSRAALSLRPHQPRCRLWQAQLQLSLLAAAGGRLASRAV